MKFIWRTDIHLSDKTPTSRKDNWKETIFNKIRQVGKLAEKHKAVAVLDGGDFFDIKSPSRNSHELVRETIDIHKEYPCRVYACVGNHDCVYGDYSFLHQQPLGVLFSSGCFERLYDQHEVTFEENGVKVRVVGIPYHGVEYDMERFKNIKKGDEDWLICVAHVLASEKGGSMFEGEDIIKYADLTDLDPDVFCFGHWHKNQGITNISHTRQQWVVNIGSLSRGSLTQDNLDRIPCVALMEFDKEGIHINEIPLEIEEAEEVFDIEKRLQEQVREDTMNELVSSIQTRLKSTQGLDLRSAVKALDLPDTVKERAISYIEKVDR